MRYLHPAVMIRPLKFGAWNLNHAFLHFIVNVVKFFQLPSHQMARKLSLAMKMVAYHYGILIKELNFIL